MTAQDEKMCRIHRFCNRDDCYICDKTRDEEMSRQARMADATRNAAANLLPLDGSAQPGLSLYAWMRARGD